MVHCENGDAVDHLVKKALAEGNTDPIYHALTRPEAFEAEATGRAIRLAEYAGVPMFIVHVTCREAAEEIIARPRPRRPGVRRDLPPVPVLHHRRPAPAELRGRALRVLAAAARRVQPARSSGTHCASTTCSSCPPTIARSTTSRSGSGSTTSPRSRTAWPSSSTACRMLWDAGVREGRLSPNRLVELTSTRIAKIFGLFPRKGDDCPGSRRRPRHLRPAAQLHVRDGHVAHERRLRRLRRPHGGGVAADDPVPRDRGVRRRAHPHPARPRPVRAAVACSTHRRTHGEHGATARRPPRPEGHDAELSE